MLILGLLAMAHAALFPGLIVLHFVEVRGFLLRSLLVFACSLTFNFELVYLLNLSGVYSRAALCITIAVELLVIALLMLRRHPLRQRTVISFPTISTRIRPLLFRIATVLLWGAVVVATFTIGLDLLRENPGVFHVRDDVMSWNRWAIEWFHGQFPTQTSYYPQLLPASWSATYVLTGSSDVQMFAKGLVALFPIAVLLVCIDASKKLRSPGQLASAAVCAYLFLKLLGPLGSGYADIPVAFFSLLTLYLIVLHFKGALKLRDTLIAAAITASGAALTKQAGFFALLVAVLSLATAVFRAAPNQRKRWTLLAAGVIAICIMVTPWYAMKYKEMREGKDLSNVDYVTSGIYAEKNPIKRIVTTSADFPSRTGLPQPFLFGALPLVLLSLRTPVGRAALFFVAIPYYLLWAAFFSYDNRNLAVALPFFAIAAGEGVTTLLHVLGNGSHPENQWPRSSFSWRVPNLFLAAGLLSCFLLAGMLALSYPDKKLLAYNNTIRENVGDPVFNQKILEFHRVHGLRGKVISDGEMCVLPDVGQYCNIGRFKSNEVIPDFSISTDFCAILEQMVGSEDIRYMIVIDGLFPNLIDTGLRQGTLIRLFGASGKSFLEINCAR